MIAGSYWPALVAAGLVTYLTRLSFIALLGRFELSPLAARALRFVPPAVLSAIVLPELVLRSGELDLSWHNARLLAGIVAALVAWRTRNVLLTIAVGMAALWGLQALLRGEGRGGGRQGRVRRRGTSRRPTTDSHGERAGRSESVASRIRSARWASTARSSRRDGRLLLLRHAPERGTVDYRPSRTRYCSSGRAWRGRARRARSPTYGLPAREGSAGDSSPAHTGWGSPSTCCP